MSMLWGSVTRRFVVILLLCTFGFLVCGCSQDTSPTVAYSGPSRSTMTEGGTSANGPAATGETVNWDRLTSRAVSRNKPVYIEFTAPWCPNCRVYERDTLSQSEAKRALNQVIFVQANFDRNRNLADQFGVTGIPTGVLLVPQNNQLKMIDKHVGGLSVDGLIGFLDQAKSR